MDSFFQIPIYEKYKPDFGSHFMSATLVSCNIHSSLAWGPLRVRNQLPAALIWELQSPFPAGPCGRYPVKSRAKEKEPHSCTTELCSSSTSTCSEPCGYCHLQQAWTSPCCNDESTAVWLKAAFACSCASAECGYSAKKQNKALVHTLAYGNNKPV